MIFPRSLVLNVIWGFAKTIPSSDYIFENIVRLDMKFIFEVQTNFVSNGYSF